MGKEELNIDTKKIIVRAQTRQTVTRKPTESHQKDVKARKTMIPTGTKILV